MENLNCRGSIPGTLSPTVLLRPSFHFRLGREMSNGPVVTQVNEFLRCHLLSGEHATLKKLLIE